MSQKIWVIKDEWNESPAKSQMKESLGPKPRENFKPQKSPALSFSLSMFIWGGGHLYIREYAPGSKFIVTMLFFYGIILSMVFSPEPVRRFIIQIDVPVSILITGSVIFLIAGLVLWVFSAAHAYSRAAASRLQHFQGVNNEFWPLLCSLLFPGWGKFLNGQPKKGLFFLLFGILGIFSASVFSVTGIVWPALETGFDRFVFEVYFAAALSFVPISLLMWVVSAHDAFWSCREPVRKRHLLKRLQLVRDRMKLHGSRRVFIQQIRNPVILAIVLSIVALAGMQFSPGQFYFDSLEEIRVEMLNSNMQLTPKLLGKVIGS